MGTVRLHSIHKSYGRQQVISGLSLDVADGEFVTLLGPSGCGKTTLLRMVAGLEAVDAGELYIDGRLYNRIPAQKRPIAMVFQSYALFPHMSIRDNVLFGLRIQKAPAETQRRKLEWVIPMLGLQGLEKRLPREVSGGQKQRVALARALVLDPSVLLLDEPLSNLDAALRDTATEELKRIHQQVGKTIIYVTHNQVEAMTMSGRIAVLNGGKLEQYDTPKAVYDHPRTVFAAEFIGSPAMNFLSGTVATQEGETGVQTPIGFLALDRERTPAAEAMAGREVKVGIRPQNIAYVKHLAARRSSDSRVSLRVELIETMGDRSLVVGRAHNGTVLRFVVTRDEDLQTEEVLTVAIDGRRLHLFDPQTGLNALG